MSVFTGRDYGQEDSESGSKVSSELPIAEIKRGSDVGKRNSMLHQIDQANKVNQTYNH